MVDYINDIFKLHTFDLLILMFIQTIIGFTFFSALAVYNLQSSSLHWYVELSFVLSLDLFHFALEFSSYFFLRYIFINV